MDVIAGQNAFYDMNAHLGASLANDLANTLAHGTLQNLVTVFCRPDDVITVQGNRASKAFD